jgi:hypothetical protein
MRKIVLILLLVLVYSANAQERFSSKEYNFAITFPKGWDVNTKSGRYIIEANEDNDIGISIAALKYPKLLDSMDIGYIAKDSLKKIIEEQMKSQYKKVLVLNSGIGTMDGVLAYYYFIQYSDKKDGYPIKFVSFQYQFLYRTIFYSIFAICPADEYEKYEKIFNNVYSTFRFIEKL